jgi:hypothetical protein
MVLEDDLLDEETAFLEEVVAACRAEDWQRLAELGLTAVSMGDSDSSAL